MIDSEWKKLASKLYPKDVLTAEFAPGRRLIHFLILLANVPGSLESAAALAKESRINILSGFHHAPSAAKEGLWSFFADFTETELTPSNFAAKLKSLPSVRDVKFKEGSDGLIIDSFHFPPVYGTEPTMIIRRKAFSVFLGRVREILGTGPVAGVILSEMGISAGRSAHEYLKGTMGERAVREQLKELLSLYTAAGWGVATVSELDEESRRAVVRLEENFECQPHKGELSAAYSHFVRGDLAGLFGEVFRTRVRCVETRCVAKGDEFCEFSIKADE